MSDHGNSTPPNKDPLQFDVAESPAAADAPRSVAPCKGCSKPITDAYYQVNGSIVCATCRASLDRPRGTRLGRAIRATSFGVVAAVAGAILYIAIAKITGFELALVSVAVGFMVGTAVRKGSAGRGGRAYQFLAAGLTYLSIASINVPRILSVVAAKEKERTHATAPTQMDTINISAHGPASAAPTTGQPVATSRDTGMTVSQAGAPTTRALRGRPPLGRLLLAFGLLLLLAARLPFIIGFSDVIGLIIIAVAVFQAWKLNQRITLTVKGPYRLGAGASGAESVG
jgi:hypothetical protein